LPLESAHAIHQSFGAVNESRLDLGLLCIALTASLQWPEALQASDELWNLRDHVDDVGALYAMAALRTRVLTRTGRFRDAQAVLRDVETAHPEGKMLPYALTFHEVNAELAWARGDAERTIAEIDQAWKILPPAQMRDDDDIYSVLLRQRAAFSLGRSPGPGLAAEPDGQHPPAPVPLLVASAESAAHAGRVEEAQARFQEATAAAERQDVPAATLLAASAYARWLLGQRRYDDASAAAGRVSPWADRDFDSALLQVEVFHAAGQLSAWKEALRRAKSLAGERTLPEALLQPPAS
jgi:tetratricopeptide (TPR) repeat protein